MKRKHDEGILIIQTSSKPGSSKKLNKAYQADAIQAARDLRYPECVVAKIHAAKSDIEIDRIMRTELHKRLR